MKPYSVVKYSRQCLVEALANSHCSPLALSENHRVGYLDSHLSGLGVTSLIVENDYTDGDYVEDFSAFYSSCHTIYSPRCKRLHFFVEGEAESKLHEPGVFDAILQSRGEKRATVLALLQKAYRGFTVARPLPYAVIGRTVFTPWEDDDHRRSFEVSAPYLVTLFGIPLVVEGFPSQEQDSATAACATIALWSCLQHAKNLFRCQGPRAAALTKLAMLTEVSGRVMPNAGLTISQVCSAARAVGLECEVFVVSNKMKVRVPWISIVQGYLRLKLPILLVCSDIQTGEWHALAVAGFGLNKASTNFHDMEWKSDEVTSKSLWIEEFYAHDDQRGPYCHYHIERQGQNLNGAQAPRIREWHPHELNSQNLPNREFYVEAIIVPIYAKIRLNYTNVYLILDAVSALLQYVSGRRLSPGLDTYQFQWDTYLTTSSRLKSEWLEAGLNNATYSKLILANLPRYLWRATCSVGDQALLELLIDATDTPRSMSLVACLWSDDELGASVQKSCANAVERPFAIKLMSNVLGHVLGTLIIELFALPDHLWRLNVVPL